MEYQIAQLPLNELHFDPENPRIPSHVDASDDQDVLGWMLGDAGLVELMGSIAVKGFFPAEPLLVTNAEGTGGGHWVLEGNRRLAAVTLLLEPGRAPKRKNAVAAMAEELVDADSLQVIPCVVFRDRSDVLDYLGYRHITGIKQWEPAAKARYLRSLYVEHLPERGPQVYKYIARLIGSRSDYVQRLLVALHLHDLIASSEVDILVNEEDVKFSLLTLSLNYKSIVAYLGLESMSEESFQSINLTHVANLATWLYVDSPFLNRTQLGDSRNMRLLAAAVSRPEGLAALERGESVEEAAKATLDATKLLMRALTVARERLLYAQAQLHRAELDELVMGTIEELITLTEQIQFGAISQQRKNARRSASSSQDDDV